LLFHLLARALGPEGHAEGDHRKAQRGSGAGAAGRERQGAAHRPVERGVSARAAHAGGTRGISSCRDREVVADHQGGRHQGAVMLEGTQRSDTAALQEPLLVRRIDAIAVALPLKSPMKMAGITIEKAENLLVRVEATSGAVGWGEAPSAPTMT